MNHRALLFAIVSICLGVTAQAPAQVQATNAIAIEHAWARATPAGARTAAVYLTIVNRGTAVDQLAGASTPLAAKLQFHQRINDNGVVRMRERPSVVVAPGTPVTLKPGNMHTMTIGLMIGLKRQLKEGQNFPLALEFEKAGKVTLQVPIAKAGAMGDHDMSGM